MGYNKNMKKFLSTLLNRLGWVFYALTILRFIKSAKSKVKEHLNDDKLFPIVERYNIAYKASNNALRLFNIHVEERGLKDIPRRPVLFVSNHKSNFDAIVMIKILFENEGFPFFNFISKIEVKKNKYGGPISELIDSIFIDRSNPRDIVKITTEAKKVLSKNSVIVFPEGTRIKGEAIGEMKSGALESAYLAMVPIVPVVIYGTNACIQEGEKRPNYRYKTVIVEFLPRIKPKDFLNTKREFLMKKIENQISKRYAEIRKEELEKYPIKTKK